MSASSAIGTIVASLITAGLVAAAGSQGGIALMGWSVFGIAVTLAFLIQWIVFIHAYARQTERFFDLTGSITYLGLIVLAISLGNGSGRSLLIGLLVSIWAIRLGKFLYGRIRREGEDRRFRSLMRSFSSFLMTWTLQGLWVSMTLAAGLAAMTSEQSPGLDAFALAGAAIWLIGFAIEVIADQQKKSFRADATNKGKFICSGLWGWSRHPNYVGEIILWTGVAIISLPALSGWQLVTMVSPLFVWILLAHVSGVPMLETQADEKWGGDPDYQAYKSRTARLFPTTFKRIVR